MSSSKIPISTNRMCQPSTIAQTILTLLCDSANIPRPKFFARAFSATRRPPKNWTQACRHPVPTRGVGLFVGRQEVRGSRLVSETHAFNRPPERNNFSTTGSGHLSLGYSPAGGRACALVKRAAWPVLRLAQTHTGAAPALLRRRRRLARPLRSFSGPPVASKPRATGPGPIVARIGPGSVGGPLLAMVRRASGWQAGTVCNLTIQACALKVADFTIKRYDV
jgi:hypothetical protein